MVICPKCNEDIENDPPDYDKERFRIKRKLIKKCTFGNGSTDIDPKKISKRAKESKISQKKIREKLEEKDGEMLRWFFIIDPIRQSIHEDAAAKYIHNIPGVKLFHNLPKSGKKTKYIVKGEIYAKKKMGKKKPKSKSIDFEFKYGKYTIFVSHKYTKESGGGQEDFKRELGTFLEEAKNSKMKNTLFLAIGDGGFNKQELEYWKNQGDGKKSFALSIEVLEHFLTHFK